MVHSLHEAILEEIFKNGSVNVLLSSGKIIQAWLACAHSTCTPNILMLLVLYMLL